MPKPPKVTKVLKAMKVVYGMFDVTDMGLIIILVGMAFGSIKYYLICGQYGDCLV